MPCARAVRKVVYFGPFFPDGQGDAVTAVFPCTAGGYNSDDITRVGVGGGG